MITIEAGDLVATNPDGMWLWHVVVHVHPPNPGRVLMKNTFLFSCAQKDETDGGQLHWLWPEVLVGWRKAEKWGRPSWSEAADKLLEEKHDLWEALAQGDVDENYS